MARLARVVVPGIAHHVTQRGVRRMKVFFSGEDYETYSAILARQAERHKLEIWAYCLMPNHVHLIAVPATPLGLARPFGEAHRLYAELVNKRMGWTGHLWQERFSSFPMDEAHLRAAIRYVLLNPVRAGLAESATGWAHSSARAHLLGEPDRLVNPEATADRFEDWVGFLDTDDSDEDTERLRRHSRIGRPLGSEAFVEKLEALLGRTLRPAKPGRKPKKR